MPLRKLPTLRSLMQASANSVKLENGSWLFEQNVRSSSFLIACGYFIQTVKRVTIQPRKAAPPDKETVQEVKALCDQTVDGMIALMEKGYPVAELLDVAIKSRIMSEVDVPHLENVLNGVDYGDAGHKPQDSVSVGHGGTGI